ncbi:tetratricopeptide repeat protein [Chloroherpeton thalassium]|nr:tetratricopeptide repeat protein [Chloroherpeton thalassium]
MARNNKASMLKNIKLILLLFICFINSNFVFALEKDKNNEPDTLKTSNDLDDKISRLSRLIPDDALSARTGDPKTDYIFSNYTVDQIKLMIDEYTKKLEKTKQKKKILSSKSIEVGEKFIKVFPESKVIDEIVIRQADLLYNKAIEEFDEKYLAYANESLKYAEILDKYDKGETSEKPTEPIEPDYGFDKVITLYDLIINNMPESPYVVDAYYGKAYIYGENLNKKDDAVAILREITRKYPDSRYTIDSYMLIAEYLFGAPSRQQPRKTIESIPYYKKVLDLVSSKGITSKYYDQSLYKLGWAYFRIGGIDKKNYEEAIAYFTSLCDDLEHAEEIFSGQALPDYVDTRLRDESLEYIATSFVSIQKKIDDTKSGVDRVETYFKKLSPPRRYEPIVYEKLGEAYENLLEEPKKIIEVYKTLLRRFPDYEKAPLIAQKIITQLDQASLEEGRSDREEIEKQLYEERKRLFYKYGRTSDWFAKLKNKIEAQSRGDTLAYSERSIATNSYDPKILDRIDNISRQALFNNIVYGVSRAQLLDGSVDPPLGIVVERNNQKAIELYEQVVKDVDNYVQFFSRYDSAAYYALFQKSFILDTKLSRKKDALEGYLDIAKNFAWDYYRKPATINAYIIATEIAKEQKLAQYTPGIDTVAKFSGQPDSLKPDEKKYIDVLETLVRLFPHDSLAVPSLQVLSTIYLAKGYTKEYKEINSRLLQYYPIQNIDAGVLVSLCDFALFEEKDYVKSEQLAKAIYYGPSQGADPKDKKRRDFAYKRIGESISQQAEYYKKRENYIAAARQYERAARTVPEWKDANQAAVLASDNYVLGGRTEDAVRINNYLINKASDDPSYKVKAYKGIVLAYERSENFDSLSTALENIADVFPDSTQLAEESLKKSIKASMRGENWKNAIRVTDKYLSRFADSKDAPDIAFNKIDLNVKLGNEEGVFDAYGEFADKYVDKPLSVKAYFRRGEYLEKKKNIEGAKGEFEKAIERSEKLKGQADVWASESLYKLTDYLIEDYKATPVKMVIAPSAFQESKKTSDLKSAKKKKASVQKDNALSGQSKDIAYDNNQKLQLKDKIGNYTIKLINLGGYRVIDAYYVPGFLSEDLANNYSNLPDTLYKAINNRGEKILDFKRDINIAQANVDASQGYRIAGNDYATAYKNLTKAKEEVLAEQKGASSIDTTQVEGDSLQFASIDTTSLANLNFVIDSLMTATGNVPDELKLAALNGTIEKTKSKISEMYYKSGLMKEKSVYVWLNSVVPDEVKNKEIKKIQKIRLKNPLFIGDIAELLQLSKIASSYVQPSVVDGIKTYDAGIKRSRELGLNNEYIKKSNDAIVGLAPKAAERIDSLARVSGILFDKLDKEYREKLASITNFKTDDQIDLTLKIEKMKLVITNYNNLATSAVLEYYNAYQLLKDIGAPQEKLTALADTATKFIYELGDRSMSRNENFDRYAKSFTDIFNSDFNKYWYSDAEGPYRDLGKLWKIAAQNVLGQVVDFVDEFGFQSQYTQRALRRLVNSDPRKFSIGQESKQTLSIVTDSEWKYAKDAPDYEWYSKNYDDSKWQFAVVNRDAANLYYIQKLETKVPVLDTVSVDTIAVRVDTTMKDTLIFKKAVVSVSPIWFKSKSLVQPPASFTPDTAGYYSPDMNAVPSNAIPNESIIDGTEKYNLDDSEIRKEKMPSETEGVKSEEGTSTEEVVPSETEGVKSEGEGTSTEEVVPSETEGVKSEGEGTSTEEVVPSETEGVKSEGEGTSTEEVVPSETEGVKSEGEGTSTEEVVPSETEGVKSEGEATSTEEVVPSETEGVKSEGEGTSTEEVVPSETEGVKSEGEGTSTEEVVPSETEGVKSEGEATSTEEVVPSETEGVKSEGEGTSTEEVVPSETKGVKSEGEAAPTEKSDSTVVPSPNLWDAPPPDYLNPGGSLYKRNDAIEEAHLSIYRKWYSKVLVQDSISASVDSNYDENVAKSTLSSSSSDSLSVSLYSEPLVSSQELIKEPDSLTIAAWISAGGYKDSLGVWMDSTGMVLFNEAALLPPPEPDPEHVYFRKEFEFDGAIDIAQLVLSTDIPADSMEIYINGDPIEVVYESVSEQILSFVGIPLDKQFTLDISKFVKDGKNVIAVKVPGTIQGAGLKAMVNILYFGKLTDEQIKVLVKQISTQRREARKALEEPAVEESTQ